MKYSFILLFFLAGSSASFSQAPVEFIQDTSITWILERYESLNEKEPVIAGYRIQLVAKSGTNSKKEANDVKAKFLSKYPQIPAYVVYQQPNFKVRIGDYRDRFAAYRFFRELKKDFPGAFIVKDNIQYPALEEWLPPSTSGSK